MNPFLNISLSTGYNSESTLEDGYSYYGSDRDWTTFDDGHRELPSIFRNDYQLTSRTPASLEQYGEAIPNIWSIDFDENLPDVSAKISGGTNRDTDNGRIGVIFALDYSSKFRNYFGEQFSYSATNAGLVIQQNFSNSVCEGQGVSTEYCGFNTTSWNTNLNGLLSVGWEIDANNEIKYTGVLLRSSQKQVQIKGGSTDSNDLENTTRLDWKEREVISMRYRVNILLILLMPAKQCLIGHLILPMRLAMFHYVAGINIFTMMVQVLSDLARGQMVI